MKKTSATKTRTPAYQKPKITTFTEKQLLEELGPARAGLSGNQTGQGGIR